MKSRLKQIYRDLAEGKLTQQTALEKIRALKLEKRRVLLSAPVWEKCETPALSPVNSPQFSQRYMLLCGWPDVFAKQLEARIADAHCVSLPVSAEKNGAERFSEAAGACFELIKRLLQGQPIANVLIQVVVPYIQENKLFSGLSGLLKTAELENPRLIGQCIFTEAGISPEKLAILLQADTAGDSDKIIKYENGARYVWRLQEVDTAGEVPNIVFKDRGVYLITGGLGGLGLLFAREIIKQTGKATVILSGRSELSSGKKYMLEAGSGNQHIIKYIRLDVNDIDRVTELIGSIKNEYGQLNGILHCAGIHLDNFILKKTRAEFDRVLLPKVTGTFNLDKASRDTDLDFMVLFSSVASWLGNSGQADYAAANAFMDHFAVYRNTLLESKQRKGRTLSINWPLWEEGGMRMDRATQERLEEITGIRPLSTAAGLLGFYRSIESGRAQIMVTGGDHAQIHRSLFEDQVHQPVPETNLAANGMEVNELFERALDFVADQLAVVLKIPAHQLGARIPLEKYGIDSILSMSLTNQLEKTFGSLPKTLFFEYQTIQELTEYFVKAYRDKLIACFAGPVPAPASQMPPAPMQAAPVPAAQVLELQTSAASARQISGSRFIRRPKTISASSGQVGFPSDPIAIIGLSGRYPEARNIDEYWQNLRDGKDCIVEVPRERWDWRAYHTDDRSKSGHHYSKWGGFIEGVDEFDPRFFNISPKEAIIIDPQERLFLQHVWMAVEDAGYTRSRLQIPDEHGLAGQVGVYAGVMYGEYQLFGRQDNREILINSYASIANRVSYVLDLHGPSMTLDTMCSSSLTAIHLACQDLKLGRTSLAIAGGVNVSIHPNKYLFLSAGQFISGDGHCQSFGEGGDGYIPGEGVGVVILKRLAEAVRDGDHIYGVIRGSALNHGGRTNGYSVPNPRAQTAAVSRALTESNTNARHISYIEAHGTGTKLGDPIEIAALSQAFEKHTRDQGFCLLGSAKSNIGHCESAAGIAGLTKVLLQLQHRQIAPSLHSEKLNPHIDFHRTPFIVNQRLRSWEPPVIDGEQLPRIAGVSSFGAGGSNAHILVQEYVPAAAAGRRQAPARPGRMFAVPLSARTEAQLKQKAKELLAFIQASQPDPAAMAYTLQTGREAMEERLAFIVESADQLTEKLKAYCDGGEHIAGAYKGEVRRNAGALSVFSTDADLQETIDKWLAQKKLPKLLDLWVKGLDLDWNRLYDGNKPARISLPTYPFAKERYWVNTEARPEPPSGLTSKPVLHPLLHTNTSDMTQLSYSSTFSGSEFFFVDDQEAGIKMLLGAAYLEMARVAVEKALPVRPEPSIIELRAVVWGQPFLTTGSAEIRIALFAAESSRTDFEIYSKVETGEIIHCQGQAVFLPRPAQTKLDIEALKRQKGLWTELPWIASRAGQGSDYVLHPDLIDKLLQESIGLISGSALVPCGFTSLNILSPLADRVFVGIRYAPGNVPGDRTTKLDIDLCDQDEMICVQLRGVAYQQIPQTTSFAGQLAVPGSIPAGESPRLTEEAELTKPTGIQVSAPAELALERNGAAAGKSPVVLSDTVSDFSFRTNGHSTVSIHDYGNGVYAIEVRAENNNTLSGGLIGQLLKSLELLKKKELIKVLIISGKYEFFLRGGLNEYNQAVRQALYEAIVSFPYPVIAAMRGDATGAGFLAGALCDFMICSREGNYGYTAPQEDFFPAADQYRLLEERFGASRAADLLYLSTRQTGGDLEKKGWTFPVMPRGEVNAYAQKLAANLAEKPAASLQLLKGHLAGRIYDLVKALSPAGPLKKDSQLAKAGHPLSAPAGAIRLETHQDNILAIKLLNKDGEYGPASLLTDLTAIFTQAGNTGRYKSIVLASEYPGFLPGAEQGLSVKEVLGFQQLLLESRIPVIAALESGAKNLVWFIFQFCDACVYSAGGRYTISDTWPDPELARQAGMIFSYRFDPLFAKEIVLAGYHYDGLALQQRAGTVSLAQTADVLPLALQMAGYWATLPMEGILSWKKQTAANIREIIERLPVWPAPEAAEFKPLSAVAVPVDLESTVISATAYPEGILVVKMEDRDAKNMFSDAFTRGMTEVFAHIEKTPRYKVVILTGFDNYFSSGGTKETLLAIQAGKVRFTDKKVYQLAMDCSLPVIAAMQGHGIGAGWALGMFADFILLSEESNYMSPYMNYGFTPGAGATFVFPRKAGYDLARETLLTAKSYAGSDLKKRKIGIPVLRREQIHEAAFELARQLARHSRSALTGFKYQWTFAFREPLKETYEQELSMHDKTFVGQDYTLSKINQNFTIGSIDSFHLERAAVPAAGNDGGMLPEVTAGIRKQLAEELHLDEHEIDDETPFIDLGLDSITGVTWIRRINEKYKTSIEATKIYSYPSLVQLSRFVKSEAEKVGSLPDPAGTSGNGVSAGEPVNSAAAGEQPGRSSLASGRFSRSSGKFPRSPLSQLTSRRKQRPLTRSLPARPAGQPEPIAVIGMAGQFPMAGNLDEFWQNIARGKNCISEIPGTRWDIDQYFQEHTATPGKTNSKWSGVLEEYDLFDPLFFNLSPVEAERMDPQQRILLQACWHSIENAGYNPKALSGSDCGVYIGCAGGDYHLLSRELQISALGFTGGAASILAARISYLLNLHGPCLSIDTACSSSLVAIATACDNLISGNCNSALAGGVYVMVGPDMHIKSAQSGMLSADGKCYTFDQRANGFVPGEGVGVVMLKRLSDAEKDGDLIHGLIRGWGINQDGKTNGITAPNEESQTRLEQGLYDKFRIDPNQIQLIEAHGTGTKIGDPIEVNALKETFKKYTEKKAYCALGSVKSNIGHCLTAAGAASFIKTILALKHKQLPPTINYEKLNEHISLDGSPFYVNDRLRAWELNGAEKRQAAISAFGFSGTNAHIVVSEYQPGAVAKPPVSVIAQNSKLIIPLSARTEDRLKQKAVDLLGFIREKEQSAELVEMAYTLQTGREAMGERVAFMVSSTAQLAEKLQAYIDGGEDIQDVYQGQVKQNKEGLSIISRDDDLKKTIIETWVSRQQLSKLADLWVRGMELDWNRLYGDTRPARIALPVYPFAKERYWIGEAGYPGPEGGSREKSGPGIKASSWDKLSYLCKWEEQLGRPQETVKDHRSVLIICSGPCGGFETVIREFYKQLDNCRITLLYLSDNTVQLREGGWTCDIRDPDSLQKCLQNTDAIDAFYFLAINDAQKGLHTFQELTDNQERNEIQLLRIVKYLSSKNKVGEKADTYILTLDNYAVDQSECRCFGAGVTGFAYSLAQAKYQFLVRNIDLSSDDLKDRQAQQGLFETVYNEPFSSRGEVVKIRSGRRYRQEFVKLHADRPGAPAIRENGVYLIAGGSGTVGKIITRNLIRKYNAQVIWTGRSAVNSEKVQTALKSHEEFSDRVHYFQADLKDESSMRHAVELAKKQFGKIDGAIFAGMVFGFENSIDETSEEEFRAILEVKTHGSWVFYNALKAENPDFMCYFSSGQAYSFSGASRLSAYATAITFSDRLVRSFHRAAAFPVGIINWGFWNSSVEIIAKENDGRITENLDALGDLEGFGCFEAFVNELKAGRISQVLCMKMSGQVKSLVNCHQDNYITLASAQPVDASLPVQIPDEKIDELKRAHENDQLESRLAGFLYHRISQMIAASGRPFPATVADLQEQCGILDKYTKWLQESLSMLSAQNYIRLDGGRISDWKVIDRQATAGQWQLQKERYCQDANMKSLVTLLDDCLQKIPEVLRGAELATDVIFPGSTMEKVEGIYKQNKTADLFNEIVAGHVVAYLQQKLKADPDARLRILEIGAGTGGTSAIVFEKLRPFRESIGEYCYTDISKAFFFHAGKNYVPENPYVHCQRLDIESPVGDQGIETGSYDLVIATNVLHATKNIRKTIRNAKAALCKNGFIILNEFSEKSLTTHLTFGLLDGWWLFEDADRRIPNCPGLYPSGWKQVLEEEGFTSVRFPAANAHMLGQQIILAQSDGIIRQVSAAAPMMPAAAPMMPAAAPMASAAAPAVSAEHTLPDAKPARSVNEIIRSSILGCLTATLKISSDEIDPEIAFSDYGVDSILGANFINQVNNRLSITLNTAVIFEYASLNELSKHVFAIYGDQLSKQVNLQHASAPEPRAGIGRPARSAGTTAIPAGRNNSVQRQPFSAGENEISQIAVIGMSGMMPKAGNLREFWSNIINGVDGVAELPGHYLDHEKYYSPEKQAGKTRCKWGGIVEERDCFDPLFFNLSPWEAESMSPHQRLILQEGWKAIEDAGYNPKSLSASKTGVFIGVEPSGYYGETFTGYSDAIIPARLSYLLNLKGPALAVNTGCSSSGVALHLACESLRNKETDMAMAGGVNACMDHNVQIRLDEIDMLSPAGRCNTFDAAGSGTIISEGVGVVLLKRLEDAIASKDFIYGVICGSGTNQDGSSNGITAPNGTAQEELIVDVYNKFGINPAHIGYVEAHGTGTKLGDPVEAGALVRAFKKFTSERAYCAVGSAKSHVGHTGAAAAVTGLMKVLLSIKHRQIPGLLHFNTINPLIEFAGSPFYINTQAAEWRPAGDGPRMAAINSFGHSGTNVHLVVKEYIPQAGTKRPGSEPVQDEPVIIPLSARTAGGLRQKAADLLAFIGRSGPVDLLAMAHTLQTGREAMEERLGFVVSSIDQLAEKLQAYLNGESEIAAFHQGRLQRNKEAASLTKAEADLTKEPLEKWVEAKEYSKLLALWVRGADLDWAVFYSGERPQRICLPSYPFAKERYWYTKRASVDDGVNAAHDTDMRSIEALIDKIASDSIATGEAVYLLKNLVQS